MDRLLGVLAVQELMSDFGNVGQPSLGRQELSVDEGRSSTRVGSRKGLISRARPLSAPSLKGERVSALWPGFCDAKECCN